MSGFWTITESDDYKAPQQLNMMTSSNGNISRIIGHLCREFTGHRWIHRTKASEAELWSFLWSVHGKTVE